MKLNAGVVQFQALLKPYSKVISMPLRHNATVGSHIMRLRMYRFGSIQNVDRMKE
jgi:hypothetical protein